MKIVQGNIKAAVISVALVLSSFGTTALAAEVKPAPEPGLTDQAAAYMRDYLSDYRRAGSLAGSILGGALFAHPAGPILGSLVGFFIGKQTMFNEDKARNLQAQSMLAKRDIVPKNGNGQGIPTLSFANAQGVKFETPPADSTSTAALTPPAPGAASAPMPLAPPLPIPMAMPSNFSRQQIAAMCGGGRALIDPRLQSLCFYFQGDWPDERTPAAQNLSLATPQ